MSKRKCILLVVDGLGVGEMDDIAISRPQDLGANTLGNILKKEPWVKLNNLRSANILDYYIKEGSGAYKFDGWNISLGRCSLAHYGADSYVGHQEISGTLPKKPIRQFVREVRDELLDALKKDGFNPSWKNRIILADKHIAIADNIETDYGLNINVVGSLDYYDFKRIEEVGRIVRKAVRVGRVITMGGVNVKVDDFYKCLEIKKRDGYTAWGINIPKLGIYNEKYRVVHMGFGVDPSVQISQILCNEKIPVTLIGKAADVITADRAEYLPEVYTDEVVKKVIAKSQESRAGFIFANIQETDLSGHEQDSRKYALLLEKLDEALPKVLNTLKDQDIFIITGDHGNDPTIGHTNHTREKTPFMLFSKSINALEIGERKTLSDIGATIADFFDVKKLENGKSVFKN